MVFNDILFLGMQHLVILEPEPWGLTLNETLMPQHFKNNGYRTHAVGKWHLGFFKKEYTPTYRGFDSHFGYWQGLQDYYKHTVHATVRITYLSLITIFLIYCYEMWIWMRLCYLTHYFVLYNAFCCYAFTLVS